MSKIQCVNVKIGEHCFDLYCANVPEKELRRISRLVTAAPKMYYLLSYFSTLEDVTNEEFYNFFVAVNDTRKLLERIEEYKGAE